MIDFVCVIEGVIDAEILAVSVRLGVILSVTDDDGDSVFVIEGVEEPV